MAQDPKSDPHAHKRDPQLDAKILSYIHRNPCMDRTVIAGEVGSNPTTVNTHINKLKLDGKLQEGLTVTPEWQQQQLKTYILIYTNFRFQTTEDGPEVPYQQNLKSEIEAALKRPDYVDELVLESLSIVLGADFDLILVLTAKRMLPINRFVTAWLRTRSSVVKTTTIMVGPSDESSSP